MTEAAQDQYRSLQHDAGPVSVPPQPSDREWNLHDLTHAHTHTISTMVQVLCDERGQGKP